jgi:hypothetical protein
VHIFTNKIVTTLGTFEKIGTVSRILGAITSTFRGTIYLSLALWLLVSFLNPQSSISQQIQNGAISSNTQKVAATFYNGMASLMNNSEIEADEKL